MNTWMYAYLIGSAVSLLILVVMVFQQRDNIASMKDLAERCLCKWSQTEERAKKMEKAIEWFLSRHGMKMEYTNFSWDWNVVPVEDTDDIWKRMFAHREEIVYALYEANKKALKDWDKEKKKGGKK